MNKVIYREANTAARLADEIRKVVNEDQNYEYGGHSVIVDTIDNKNYYKAIIILKPKLN